MWNLICLNLVRQAWPYGTVRFRTVQVLPWSYDYDQG